MCGFVGTFGDAKEFDIAHAIKAIEHRGPDGQRVFIDKKIGLSLGHSRLAIIDPTEKGIQPFVSEDGKYVLVFNGEIYNFRQLRQDLEQEGHVFSSKTDTEVLLRLYIQAQKVKIPLEQTLKKLNGIFAFAIWDYNDQVLTLARDAFGVKPIYYASTAHCLFFGSEIKAFYCSSQLKKRIDHSALLRHLTYIMCPGSDSIAEGVKQVAPGQAIKFRMDHTKEIINWFDVRDTFQSEANVRVSLKTATEEVKCLLSSAVERQLVADVEVGSFLSGGLDSSLITCLARQKKEQLRCFTIDVEGVADEGFENDIPFAKHVAKELDVNLEIVKVEYNDIQNDILKMVKHLDEPLADPASLNLYFMAKQARKAGLKVLLSGVGGDDVFSGYRRHQLLRWSKYSDAIPTKVYESVSSLLRFFNHNNTVVRRADKFVKNNILRGNDRINSLFKWISSEQALSLLSDEILMGNDYCDDSVGEFLDGFPACMSDLSKALGVEQRFFLSNHNLLYTDKMGMAHGVEIRVPFLDLDLVNYVNRLPDDYKINNKKTKLILRKVAFGLLPNDIINRKKTGFAVPLRGWIRNDLSDWVNDLLSEEKVRARGIFNPMKVANIIRMNKNGAVDASYTIFCLICVELWCQEFGVSHVGKSNQKPLQAS